MKKTVERKNAKRVHQENKKKLFKTKHCHRNLIKGKNEHMGGPPLDNSKKWTRCVGGLRQMD